MNNKKSMIASEATRVEKSSPYTVVITGPIGSGKSTQCRMLEDSNPGQWTLIPEFIDDPDPRHAKIARDKLKAWVASPKTPESFLDFQKFIAGAQDRLLSTAAKRQQATVKGRILERLPSDAAIFAEAAKQPLYVVHQVKYMGWEVEMRHDLSPPDRKNWGVSVIAADQDPSDIHKQIKAIVDRDLRLSLLNGRVIKLSLQGPAVKTCLLRVFDRNRPGEREYTLGYLEDVCERYDRQVY